MPNDIADWASQHFVQLLGVGGELLGDPGSGAPLPDSVNESIAAPNLQIGANSVLMAGVSFKPAASSQIAQVGALGGYAVGTSTAVTPAFGQATVAGHLLVAWVTSRTGTPATASPGWVLGTRQPNFPFNAAIFYKPNCGAAEAAPTFTAPAGTGNMTAQLGEFSGADLAAPKEHVLDAVGSSPSTTASANNADAAFGDLVVLCVHYTSCTFSGPFTITGTYNNGGTAVVVSQNIPQNSFLNSFSYAITAAAYSTAPLQTDVTDRAGRLLGIIASIGAAVDISDRAGRLLGQVSAAAGALWDISDRAARQLGVAIITTGTGATQAEVNQTNDLASSGQGRLFTLAQITAWDGTNNWVVRSLSQIIMGTKKTLGGALVGNPGEWAITSAPAVGSKASASQASAGATARHIFRGGSFGFSATTPLGAVTAVTVNLRDGATGAGTVLKSWQYTLPAATIAPFTVEIPPSWIVGSQNTAMTLEFAAAVGNLLQFCNLNGTDSDT